MKNAGNWMLILTIVLFCWFMTKEVDIDDLEYVAIYEGVITKVGNSYIMVEDNTSVYEDLMQVNISTRTKIYSGEKKSDGGNYRWVKLSECFMMERYRKAGRGSSKQHIE